MASSNGPVVTPSLLSHGLCLHWLQAARYSLRKKVEAQAAMTIIGDVAVPMAVDVSDLPVPDSASLPQSPLTHGSDGDGLDVIHADSANDDVHTPAVAQALSDAAAMEEWFALGTVELTPAVSFHAISEHVGLLRCQATETNSAFAGLRLLLADSMPASSGTPLSSASSVQASSIAPAVSQVGGELRGRLSWLVGC